MQNEEWNVSAVSLSPELVRLAQQKQAPARCLPSGGGERQ